MYASCILHDTANHLPSFLSSIILITSGGRYNLWRYTLCTFLQYPITFNHKSLRTDQFCSQTQSTAFAPSVTPTGIKILRKQTHVYTSIASFVKAGRIAKHYKAAVCISTNSFTLNFFTLQSLLLNPTTIYFQFPPSQHSKQRISWVTFCTVRCPHCKPRIYNKRRNVDSQRTTSL
jgi:hypothetical protein